MNDFIFFLFAYDLHFLSVFYIKIIQKSDSMRKNIKSLEVLIMCGKDRIRTYETLQGFTRFPGVPLQPLEHLSLNNACKSNVFSRYSQAQVVKTITFVSVIGDIKQQTIRGRYSENWLSMPLNEATSLFISFYFISIIRFIHITVRYMYDEFWLK